MRVALDTNVLVRAVVGDHPAQGASAARLMREASLVAISTTGLCEFAWVLDRAYKFKRREIADAIEALLAIPSVRVDRPSAEAGLKLLKAGGDFADGVLAHEGRWLGGEVFISFDRKAVSLLQEQGAAAQLLS